MINKQLTIKRILIYLFFAFIPPFILQFIYMAVCGVTIQNGWYAPLATVSMFFPAVANILTRMITKEGFDHCLIKCKDKGNLRYVIIALLLPIVMGILISLLCAVILMPEGSLNEMIRHFDFWDVLTAVIYVLSISIFGILQGFGEEFGWRGYLTPKLEQLMKAPAAIVVSGVIWGLWHAPMIVCGHNFGKDYIFYPYLGIGIMCISCVFLSFYLTELTKSSHSVLPAAWAHIAINNSVGMVAALILSGTDNYNEKVVSGWGYPAISVGVISVTACLTGIFLYLTGKKKAALSC